MEVKSENVIVEQPGWRVQVESPITISSDQKWSSFSGLSALQSLSEFIIYKRNYLDGKIKDGTTRFYVATIDNDIIYIGNPKDNPKDSKTVIELEDKNGGMTFQLIKNDKELSIKPAIGQNGKVTKNLLNRDFTVFDPKGKFLTLSWVGGTLIVKNIRDVKIASIVQTREPLSDKPSIDLLVDGYFKVVFDMPVDVQAKNFVMSSVFLLDKWFTEGVYEPPPVKTEQIHLMSSPSAKAAAPIQPPPPPPPTHTDSGCLWCCLFCDSSPHPGYNPSNDDDGGCCDGDCDCDCGDGCCDCGDGGCDCSGADCGGCDCNF